MKLKRKDLLLDIEDSLASYMDQISDSQPLSVEEEDKLAKRIRQGNRAARNRLIEANLRFVVSVAREYQGRGVSLADLISAGNMGLVTAAERFDEQRGLKFISYAVWWIRQAILQALTEQSMVRMPVNRLDFLRRVFKASTLVEQRTNAVPDLEGVADELGVSVEKVEEALQIYSAVYSLDAPFDEEGDQGLLHVLADERQSSPEEIAETHFLREDVEQTLATLSKREAEVIRLYFGIGHEAPLTLDQIGDQFGLTRERVRQIKEQALRRLRHPRRRQRLSSYIETL